MLNFTTFLKFYAKYRNNKLSKLNSALEQEKQLLKLVKIAEKTKFGIDHNFSSIKSVKDYQNNVPLRTYEDFWINYWKKHFPRVSNITWPGTVPFFAVTSGTTSGNKKYIPYTKEMAKSNSKAGLDMLIHHVTNKPNSKLFSGKTCFLGGSTNYVKEAEGIFSGDLSGISIKTMPWWAKKRTFPDENLAILSDWEEKIEKFSNLILKEDIRAISGVPAWLLIFFDKILENTGSNNLIEVFPKLEMIIHGGVNFTSYRKRFLELLDNSDVDLREVYPASEGFIATADRKYGEGLRMVLDHGIFYEFIPFNELEKENPTRHWIKNVELGVNYAIVLTSCAGCWSYILGDTVEFIDIKTHRLKITGRTSYCLSAFGEHLIADEIEDAMNVASSSININFSDYSVGSIFPEKKNDLGGHIYVVEFDREIKTNEKELFAKELDKRLSERNEDYESHRSAGFGLKAPQILAVGNGTFSNWMKKRGKYGGQHKVPRIITKQELFEDLLTFARLNR